MEAGLCKIRHHVDSVETVCDQNSLATIASGRLIDIYNVYLRTLYKDNCRSMLLYIYFMNKIPTYSGYFGQYRIMIHYCNDLFGV